MDYSPLKVQNWPKMGKIYRGQGVGTPQERCIVAAHSAAKGGLGGPPSFKPLWAPRKRHYLA